MAEAGLIGTGREDLSSRMLKKKAVYGFFAVVGLIVALCLAFTVKPKMPKRAFDSQGKTSPGFVISQLPNTYEDLPPIKPTPVDKPKDTSELDKLKMKLLEEKLKREQEARRSKIGFSGISVREDSVGSLATAESSETYTQSSRDEFNRQDDKIAFLEKKDLKVTHLSGVVRSPNTELELMAGTVISGLMLTGINSDLPGEILGQVSQNVYSTVTGEALLIPQGTKIQGRYDSRVVYGQERVLVVWTRLLFPNGNSLSLEGMPGVDLSGYAGLTDIVDNHYLRLLTGVVFSSVLGAGAQMANGQTFDTANPSFAQLAAQGAARETNQAGQMITQRNIQVQPTIVIRPGERFSVFVNKDISLPSYND